MAKNFSSRRKAILDILTNTKTHPSAEYIYKECLKVIPDISLATVYRNLAQFEQEGVIIKVATVEGKERYDADLAAHDHLICMTCGKVDDIAPNQELLNGIKEEMSKNNYITYRLNYYHNCTQCLSTNE